MKFDEESFNKSDKLCRELSLSLLNKLKCYKEFTFDSAEENPNKYSVDLILKKDGKTVGYAECEQSYSWKGGNYKYSDTRIPKRKFKYMKYSMPVLMIKVSESGDGLILFSAQEINKYGYTQEVENYRTGIEEMRVLEAKYLSYYSV